jgi:hypothetical protein
MELMKIFRRDWGDVSTMHRTFALLSTTSLLAFLLAFSTGCNKGGATAPASTTTPVAAFTVTAIVPVAGATCVATNAVIQITFSGAANPAMVDSANIQVAGSNNSAVPGAVTYNATTDVGTFTPTAALASNEAFTVTVSSVESSANVVMQTPFTAKFTSGPCTAAKPQYQSSLYSLSSDGPPNGQVSVDTTGSVTVQLTGVTDSTAFTVQFCPDVPFGSSSPVCFNVGSISSDSSGNATTSMAFPKSGSWSGDFELVSNGTAVYQTTYVPGENSQVYMSTLQPDSTVNGQGVSNNSPQDPLTSGSVTLSNGSFQFQLTGAVPNAIYSAGACELVAGSSCYQLDNSQSISGFTTNGNGDVTFTVLDNGPGDIFSVGRTGSAEGFEGGFLIP